MSSQMDKLLSAINKVTTKSYGDKDYFYYPQTDKLGNGSAVIRFLPAPSDDSMPFVRVYGHSVKNAAGKWFIEECPTTIEEECPVCEYNSTLYAKLNKDDARKHGFNRKTQFYSRIVVIQDTVTPDNEGKVFLFKYGKSIFDKIVSAAKPEFADEVAIDPFCLKNGANFKLKIRKVDNQTNYDKSTFDSVSECDLELESQYNEENDITKFIQPSKFKSADAIKKRLDTFLGNSTSKSQVEDDDTEFEEVVKPKAAPKKVVSKSTDDDDDDDVMNLINSLNDD